MNDQMEELLRNPSVLKTAEGDEYTDDTAAKWAWFAHQYDTGMEPFYSIDQLRKAVRIALESSPSPSVSDGGEKGPQAPSIYEQRLRSVLQVVQRYLPPDGISPGEAMGQIVGLVDPWPEGVKVCPECGPVTKCHGVGPGTECPLGVLAAETQRGGNDGR